MSIAQVKAKLESLRNTYPNDFRIIFSPDDVRKNNIDYTNSEILGTFDNGDMQMTEVLENALASGKQAFIVPVGQHKMLVQTSKSGKLFDLQRSPRDETVRIIRDGLEEMHDCYIGNDGIPLLLGGLDSYIYQEKFVGIAQQYSFPKYKSYDIADKSVLGEVKRRLEVGETVVVIAWTKENRIDVYVEPHNFFPQSDSYYSSDSTSSSVSTNAFVHGKNQTLPMISLAMGVLGIVLICCWGGFPFGIAAIITGFLGMNNANSDPEHYGGYGLAIAGMAVGAVSLFITIIFALISVVR